MEMIWYITLLLDSRIGACFGTFMVDSFADGCWILLRMQWYISTEWMEHRALLEVLQLGCCNCVSSSTGSDMHIPVLSRICGNGVDCIHWNWLLWKCDGHCTFWFCWPCCPLYLRVSLMLLFCTALVFYQWKSISSWGELNVGWQTCPLFNFIFFAWDTWKKKQGALKQSTYKLFNSLLRLTFSPLHSW